MCGQRYKLDSSAQAMTTSQAINTFLSSAEKFLDKDQIILDKELRSAYDHDYTEDFHFLPDLVLVPKEVIEIQQICKLCNDLSIPLTVRGAGTGLSGGALPIKGGISVSMEKFNKIIEIDSANFQATVEPGVINQVFQDAVAEKGLFYPPDPASKGSCFLGGNIAHNSGGPRALKYGVTRDYVLNLEIVTADGRRMWTGANTLKNSTGYSLTQLMLGSEGTLAIVTKIVFKLIPKPKLNLLLLAAFKSAKAACSTVSEVFYAGANPSALEFMEKSGMQISVKQIQSSFNFIDEAEAYLLVEVDGNDEEQLMKECESINEVFEAAGALDVLLAQSAEEKEHLWKIRRAIGETVKAISVYKEEDTVVPRAYLPELLEGVKSIGQRFGFESVCYGHAGDGNLHVNILKGDMPEEKWSTELSTAIREIFELCKKLGGTISGEHGIGLVQKDYMDIPFQDGQLDLMLAIKHAFDPKGILNPGKIFPDSRV